jgi:outer membrane receptor protein involved in Fe transport
LIGVYGLQLHESLNEDSSGIFFDPSEGGDVPPVESTLTDSRFQSRTGAVFGELEGDIGAKWHWTAGLRGERWTARYADNSDLNFDPANNLWGGAVSLTRKLSEQQSAYATVSRGYKAGGFNLSQGLPPDQIQFGPESALNFELGYKAELLERTLSFETAVFYMKRKSLTGEDE